VKQLVQMIPGTQVDSNGDLRRYETLLQMADLMVHHRSLPELFHELAERLQEVAAFEFASFSLHDPAKNMMVLHLFEDSEFPPAPALVAVEDSPSGWVWQNQQPLAMSDLQIETRFPLHLDILREKGFRSCCFLPMTTAQRRLGALALGSSRVDEYDEKDLRLLHRVAELVALAMENALTRWALQQEKERLQMLLEVSTTLASSHDPHKSFPTISSSIRKVVRQDYASVGFFDEQTHSLRMYALDFPPGGEVGPDTYVPVTEAPTGLRFSSVKPRFSTAVTLPGSTPTLPVRCCATESNLCTASLCLREKGRWGP